jgi:hypothetical protein
MRALGVFVLVLQMKVMEWKREVILVLFYKLVDHGLELLLLLEKMKKAREREREGVWE